MNAKNIIRLLMSEHSESESKQDGVTAYRNYELMNVSTKRSPHRLIRERALEFMTID